MGKQLLCFCISSVSNMVLGSTPGPGPCVLMSTVTGSHRCKGTSRDHPLLLLKGRQQLLSLPAKSRSSMWHLSILSTSSGILILYFSTTAIFASSSLSSAAVTYLLKPLKPSLCSHLLMNLSLMMRSPKEETHPGENESGSCMCLTQYNSAWAQSWETQGSSPAWVNNSLCVPAQVSTAASQSPT